MFESMSQRLLLLLDESRLLLEPELDPDDEDLDLFPPIELPLLLLPCFVVPELLCLLWLFLCVGII
jgi:hypothetical protein